MGRQGQENGRNGMPANGVWWLFWRRRLQPPDRPLLPINTRKETVPPIANPRSSPTGQSTGEEVGLTSAASTQRKSQRPLRQEAWNAYGLKPPSEEEQESAAEDTWVDADNIWVDADNRWVFLCHGNDGQGIAYPVRIEAFDAETQWRQLRDAWDAKRGNRRLRRLIHPLGFGVNKIERVTIYKQGHPLKPDDGWDIAYEPFDLAYEVRSLREANRATDIGNITSHYRDGYSVCGYDHDGVFVGRCPVWEDDPLACCEAAAHFQRRVEIGELQMVPRYAKFLHNPKSAVASCASLPWKLVYTEERIAQQLQSCEDVGLSAVEWEALLVTESWTFNPKSVVFPVLVTLVLVAVMASRLVYGDWGTAWTAASCLVAVIATGLAWIHMITSR